MLSHRLGLIRLRAVLCATRAPVCSNCRGDHRGCHFQDLELKSCMRGACGCSALPCTELHRRICRTSDFCSMAVHGCCAKWLRRAGMTIASHLVARPHAVLTPWGRASWAVLCFRGAAIGGRPIPACQCCASLSSLATSCCARSRRASCATIGLCFAGGDLAMRSLCGPGGFAGGHLAMCCQRDLDAKRPGLDFGLCFGGAVRLVLE